MANTFTKLDSYTVGAGGISSVTFSNIPQTYTDLHLKVSARNAGSGIGTFRMYFNNDAGSNYTVLYAQGAGVSQQAQIIVGAAGGNNQAGLLDGNTSTANTFSNNDITIPNYSSQLVKSWMSEGGEAENSTTAYLRLTGGVAYATSSITSITIVPDAATFGQYSTFALYGVWNNGTQASAPLAPTIGTAIAGNASATVAFTGVGGAASYTATSSPGSITATGTTSPITVSGLTNGTAYTFTVTANNPFGISSSSAASNSVTPVAPPVAPAVELFVVAGGGSGGSSDVGGGGGGAGGLCYQASRSVTAGVSYTVSIGSGGATTTPTAKGNSGSNSVFDTITANGGEGGAGRGTTMSSGGCGGGGPAESPQTGGTSNQGNSGGATGYGFRGGNGASSFPYFPNGGGGGTGAVGASTSTGGLGGAGGIGRLYWTNDSGTTQYYGGGGGGGTYNYQGSGTNGGAGGQGGGGAGGVTGQNPGTAGTANTGGGGGGNSANPSSPANGGAGGSGVVSLRYSSTYGAAASTTGSPTVNVANGYRTYTWTGSGSITF